MEPRGSQISIHSWNTNRDLLRRLAQERRRRQVEDKCAFWEKTPVFPKPYKTDKEDELARRIKRLLGEWDPRLIPRHETPPGPLWFPEKPKSKAQTYSNGLARHTNPREDIQKESSLVSLDLKPNAEQNHGDCKENVSSQRSEAKAAQSKILPDPVKEKKPTDAPTTEKTLKVVKKPRPSLASPSLASWWAGRALQPQQKRMAPAQPSSWGSGSPRDHHSSPAPPRAPAPEPIMHVYVQSIEGILKEMSSPLPPLLPPLQSPARAETSKLPLATKERNTEIDEPSIEEILREMSSSLPPLLPPLQSPARAETSKLPLATKERNTEIDEPSIEEILREMSSSLPPLLSPLQSPARAETSKLPLATKESQPDGSAAQKQEQAGAASETLQSSQPRTLALQPQQKRMAAAQPSSWGSGSPKDSPSSPACGTESSSSDSEEELPRVLNLPARKPEPPAYNKWWLGNLLSQAKRGAGPGEAPRGIACGNGREQGISSSSCQQLSKAREPPHKSWGQVAKKSPRTCHQGAKGSQKSTGKPAKMSHKSSGLRLKDSHKSSGQAVKDSEKSWSQVAERFPKSSGKVAKEFHTDSVQGAKVSEKSFGKEHKTSHKSQVAKDPQKSCGQVAKDCHKSSAPLAKHSQKSSGQVDQAPQAKQSCLKPSGLTKGVKPKEPVAAKRPGEPLEHNKSKRVRKGESKPGPVGVTEHSCKAQLEAREVKKPKSTESEDPKLALQKPCEERKDKGSPQASTKGFLDPELPGDAQERDALTPNGHRFGDLHRKKVPSPPEEKLLLPPRKPDLKRKEMKSPEESPKKKKREDKGDTPRKKKE